MPNSAPPACPSAAASQKPVAKNSSSPGSAAAGCAGNASLGRRFCNFAQSSSHNNGTAFGRMLCCKLRSSTSGGNYTLENYQWIPGCGPSATSLKRMGEQIKRPEEPMGEAWFMSEERHLYSEMMEQDPLKLSIRYLKDVLWEIASGTKCFGHLEEWDQWFQFLLPALVEKSHAGFEFLEDTIGAFFNVFDNGITEIYDGFRDDVISSLSLCMMKGELWYDWVD